MVANAVTNLAVQPRATCAPREPGPFRNYVDHFEHIAAVNADSCALSMAGRFFTYAALNRSANSWAQALIKRGCLSETRVAVCVDRSLEMIAALLGVLKAGAAFVPLDPQFSPVRARAIVQQSQASIVVTERRYAWMFDGCGIDLLWIDERDQRAGTHIGRVPHAAPDPDTLAYVIYTSGSTGAPKGVAIAHESFYRYITWANDYYGFDREGVSILHTSIAFDLTLTSLFCPLLAGMRIVVIPVSDGPDALVRMLDEHVELVSLLKLTPSHLRLLGDVQGSRGLRDWDCDVLIAGGEQLTAALVERWERWSGRTRIFNEYGPTETTVGCCVARVKAADALPNGALPIGSAIAGVSLRLYQSPLNPAEEQEAGELFIGGRSLARGYLDAPSLTAERFVPDSTGWGDRLYRTGDWIVRNRSGNDLAFAGRRDRQVKINGVRIELEEIECALQQCPGIRNAAVVADHAADGTAALTGYLCPVPDAAAPELSMVTRYLRERVHASAVPGTYYVLNQLPLGSGGKVDVEQLVRGQLRYVRLADSFAAPRNPREQLLASLWSAVLDREEIGIDDSFFALDGNSMKSIQFVYEAKKHGLRLTTRDVFERQTIRKLAELIAAPPAPDLASAMPALQAFALVDARDCARMPADTVDAYPLTMLQAGTLFESNVVAGSATYHNVNSYHLECRVDLALLRSSLSFVAARHPILRTCYDYVNYREPLQLVQRQVTIPLQMADIADLSAAQQEKYLAEFIHQESHTPFDWTTPPLLRFFIHLRGPGRLQFTLSKHHSILDGWSAATLITEIMKNYLALAKGQPAPFQSPLETTYRDYVALERQALASPECADFWRQALRDAPYPKFRFWGKPKPMPIDARSKSSTHAIPLGTELSSRLKDAAKRSRAPLKSVLLAVHLRVLTQMTGSNRLLTGVVSHGRPESEDANRALGLFINTVPFHITVEERFTWFDLIGRVFDEERRIFPFQRYPMARMKKDAERDRLFESVFYYTDFHIFREFRDSPDLKCLDSIGFEETEIPFTTAFSCHPLTGNIGLRLHFHHAYFSDAQITEVLGCFDRALQELAWSPDRRVLFEAPLMCQSAQPQRGLVAEQFECTMFELFQERARLHPDVVATATAERQVTFGGLLSRVEQLATALAERGVTPGKIVGICLSSVSDAISTMLAVNRVRGCFAILDAAWPDQRMKELLAQIEPALVVADGKLADRFLRWPVQVLDLDGHLPPAGAPTPEPIYDPDELAYVVFTSGSTAKPKGVMITHRNLYRSTMSRLQYYEGGYDRFLLLSRLSFDSAFAGVWGTLCSGGTLQLADPDQLADVGIVDGLIRDESVTHLLAIPSLYRILLPEIATRGPSSLRCVILAGEELMRDLVRAHQERLPAVELYNEYGPSEVTIWATVANLSADTCEATISIGSAVPHVQTPVPDSGMRPVSAGVVGELYLAGPAVGRGYFKSPALTAERFIPNPSAKSPACHKVLYRTGDLVRHTPDGELEFVQRGDNQVKVRG